MARQEAPGPIRQPVRNLTNSESDVSLTEGARFEHPEILETIGSDLVQSFRSQSLTEESEASGSIHRMDAVKLLRKRLAEMGTGQLRGPDLEKTRFAELVQIIRDDYTVNQRPRRGGLRPRSRS